MDPDGNVGPLENTPSTQSELRDETELRELAHECGVDTGFWGEDGTRRLVAPGTLRSVLKALGIAAGTPGQVGAARVEVSLAPWRRLLPAVVVLREGGASSLSVHARQGTPARVWLTLEDGARVDLELQDEWWDTRDVDGETTSRRIFGIPDTLPLGWHRLDAEAGGRTDTGSLVVTPQCLENPPELGERRTWGLMAQLYSVRSERSWGIGDFADLADLAAVAGETYGAGFVLVNPLNAAEPEPPVEPSPYLPTSRRFFNPLYLRVEDVPEYGYLPAADRAVVENLAAGLHSANHDPDRLDRDSSYAAKLAALDLVFRVPRSSARAQQFAAFCTGQGEAIQDFALWCALVEKFPQDAPEWKTLPTGPASAFATSNRAALSDRIAFHTWLQWLCDEQLEGAQRAAKRAGMGLGIVHDLPVGVQAEGADAWTLRSVLAEGVTVGAPPDMFNRQGQNWSQPPWRPDRLVEAGYVPFRDMIQTILRHAGGIRVDHILGLFRLWWIPEGSGPLNGTYVHYDHEALIGILALEAQRAGAIVIGEDLGVFEPWVRDYLTERGVLGTSILWFENADGVPLEPERYRRQCLTSVNTHDLPPTAGYLAGDHVSLRESLGILGMPVAEARSIDAREQGAVLDRVRERGLLPAADTAAGEGASVQATVEALYAYTALTPSILLGVSLVDAVGERRTQNQPGTVDEYPNWRVPLAGPDGRVVLIDDLAANARCASLVRAVSPGNDIGGDHG
jgi:4-alpha-glucanotransferase